MRANITLTSFGECVEWFTDQAIEDYQRQFHRSTDLEELWGLHIRTVEVLSSLRPGGILQITVTVYAKKKHDDTVHHARFNIRGPDQYVYRASTIAKL